MKVQDKCHVIQYLLGKDTIKDIFRVVSLARSAVEMIEQPELQYNEDLGAITRLVDIFELRNLTDVGEHVSIEPTLSDLRTVI